MAQLPNLMAGTNPQSLLAAQAQLYAGPQSIPAIQQSEYLANALRSLQDTGAQNIRTKGALASNLLADAILQFSRRANDQRLLKEIGAGQQGVTQGNLSGTGLPGDPMLSGGADQSAPSALPPGPVGAQPQAGGSPLGAAPSGSMGLADHIAPPTNADPKAQMFAALLHGGLPPAGAAGLVGNFGQESGPGLNRDNPREGAIGAANWEGPRAQAAQAYFAANGGPTPENQAAFALQELHGPEHRAFLKLMAATDAQSGAAAGLAYERPAGYRPGGDPSLASGWGNRLAGAQQAMNYASPPPQASPPPMPPGGPQIGGGPASSPPPAAVAPPPFG